MKKLVSNSKKATETAFIWGMMAYPLILFAIFYVYVNINSILLAFQNIDINGHATFIGFNNFKTFIDSLINDPLTAISFRNSFIIYGINLVVCLPLYILFSYVIFKKCLFDKPIRIIVMLPQIISGTLMGLMFTQVIDIAIPVLVQKIMGGERMISLLKNPDTALATCIFYMIWVSFSTSLIVYPNAMNSINPEIFEAAQLDGLGNMFQELWYIILPLIYPTISTFVITGFAGILTNTGPLSLFWMYDAKSEVYNMGYYYFVKIFGQQASLLDYPYLSAGGLLMTILIAPLTYLIKRILEKFEPEV